MKKVLLSALFAVFATVSVFAQICVPDTQTVFGVYPPQDTLDIGATPNGLHSPMPCGVVGSPYNMVFTAVIPTLFVYSGASRMNFVHLLDPLLMGARTASE